MTFDQPPDAKAPQRLEPPGSHRQSSSQLLQHFRTSGTESQSMSSLDRHVYITDAVGLYPGEILDRAGREAKIVRDRQPHDANHDVGRTNESDLERAGYFQTDGQWWATDGRDIVLATATEVAWIKAQRDHQAAPISEVEHFVRESDADRKARRCREFRDAVEIDDRGLPVTRRRGVERSR
ncbi:hypothetical protein ABZ942_14935 [Nocardia sp. NPDC046473]|uniref:hypothetical protein n=1 Tax=Nocardia sp. NPDC046473 TaxID=3155733 RepID=UPI003411AA40